MVCIEDLEPDKLAGVRQVRLVLLQRRAVRHSVWVDLNVARRLRKQRLDDITQRLLQVLHRQRTVNEN